MQEGIFIGTGVVKASIAVCQATDAPEGMKVVVFFGGA